MSHPNAVLTPRGRYRLVELVEVQGLTFRQAAACLNVSVATAWEWVTRWRRALPAQRRGLACLGDRSSRPHHSPRSFDRLTQAQIVLARRRTGWGPRLIAGELGMAHQSVWKVLRRYGLSVAARPPREQARRYEWPCPGDLLHMDTKRYARFTRPGHAVTGNRSRTSKDRRAALGYTIAHAIVDDHSRLAYVELHDDERAQTVTEFLERAIAWLGSHGIRVRRLMTDNAWSYTKNRDLRALCARHGIRQLATRPYTPRTNGKVERFHQTMAREWGYGMTYATDTDRARALPYWLGHYNEQRPHSALGGQAPITRVRNLCRHDN